MLTLYHHPFCPQSRFIRLVAGEYGMEPSLIEERVWERREAFLIMNPAAETPVLVEKGGFTVPGASVIAEYLDETRGMAMGERRLLPEAPSGRVEVRRLLNWFLVKFNEEVTQPLVMEKVFKRTMPNDRGGGPPDTQAIRVARGNIRYHLKYIGWLAAHRNWLAGDAISYADLAAAAHLSCADYLGDVPWGEDEAAKQWYARVKSRPAFRPILGETTPGLTPAPAYADLDF